MQEEEQPKRLPLASSSVVYVGATISPNQHLDYVGSGFQ